MQILFGTMLQKAVRFQVCRKHPDLLSGWTDTSECISATVKLLKHKASAYGVVKTELNGRGWTKWLKIPNIKYVNQSDKK